MREIKCRCCGNRTFVADNGSLPRPGWIKKGNEYWCAYCYEEHAGKVNFWVGLGSLIAFIAAAAVFTKLFYWIAGIL